MNVSTMHNRFQTVMSKQVPMVNRDVGNVLIGAMTLVGSFVLIFTGKGSSEASFGLITLIVGYYFGASTGKPGALPNEPNTK